MPEKPVILTECNEEKDPEPFTAINPPAIRLSWLAPSVDRRVRRVISWWNDASPRSLVLRQDTPRSDDELPQPPLPRLER
jgi:hypothetical protein